MNEKVKKILLSIYGNLPPHLRHLTGCYNQVHKFYQEAQWWPKEKIEAWQLERLKMMVKYAYDNTTGYRQLYGEAGVSPSNLNSLSDIRLFPTVDKSLLRDNIKDFTVSEKIAGKLHRSSTGGSTGKPFAFFTDSRYSSAEYGFMYNAWESIGWDESDIGVVLRGGFIGDENHLIEKVGYHRYAISSNYLTEKNYEKYISEIQKTKATFIHCYPSSLMELVNLIIKHCDGGRLKIKQIFISSEGLFDWQKVQIKQAFPDSRLMHWYGHSERCVWAPWCEKEDKFHINPFYGFCEIHDGNKEVGENESGEIVGTSFWMFGTPFIRYRTNDFAIKGSTYCEKCGRQFQLINSIEGRLQEYLVGKTGRKISLSAWDCHFMHGKLFEHITHFRFLQYEVGKLTLAIIPNESYTNEDEEHLIQKLNEFLGDDFSVTIHRVNMLQKSKAGKFALVEQHLDLHNLTF